MKKTERMYCYGCGAELMIKHYINGYSMETGKPEYSKRYKCPNYRFWNFMAHVKGNTGDAPSY